MLVELTRKLEFDITDRLEVLADYTIRNPVASSLDNRERLDAKKRIEQAVISSEALKDIRDVRHRYLPD